MTRSWPDVRAWCQTNVPSGRGMCLNTSMRAYNASPIGVSDATEAIGKTKDLHTSYTTEIPAGAHVLYSGGSQGHGHSCIADGDGYVWTVDWYSGLNISRVAQRDMESAWGNLDWAGWSAYYGSQALHLGDDSPDPEPEPEPEDDDVPSYWNAGGKDVTLKDGSDWQSVVWDDAWGTDIRSDDEKGFALPKGALYSAEVGFTFDPSGSASLLARVAFYGSDGWWYGATKEFFATSGSTPQGFTANGKFDHDASQWKVQLKPNGSGSVAVSGVGVRGLYW